MLSNPDFLEKKWIIINVLDGQKFNIQNDNVLVKDAEDKVVLQLTCYRIFTIWIVGTTTLTSVLLERSKKFGFSILLLNQSFRLQGVWNAPTEGNVLLRKKQYVYKELTLAKYLMLLKLSNQLSMIKSIRKKDEVITTSIQQITQYVSSINEQELHASLMGIEGQVAKMYFKLWFKDLEWKGRKPRAKLDPVNVMLDIGYTMLFNFVDALLNLYGFDTYVGVYHKEFYQRKSLVCDIIEPFRCIIDQKVTTAFGLAQVKNEDFEFMKGQYRLKYGKNKIVQKIFVAAIHERREEMFLFIQAYYRSFMRERAIEEYPIFKI